MTSEKSEILIATDGSEGAMRALDHAAALARKLDCRLVVANVVGAVPPGLFRRFTAQQNAWLEEAEAGVAAEILRAAAERARTHGKIEIKLEPRSGDAVEEVLALADERGVEMIVVGKRGNGRIGGLLLGSVSQKLVSLAQRPVLVVP